MVLGIATLVFINSCLLASLQLVRSRGLHIALHAQSRYTRHGWVAGSEITTRGLKRAFEKHPLVDQVHVFAPFAYEGLHSTQWDLVIIEGWIGTIPRFIHEIREASPGVKILHFCLDTYPSLLTIKALDVDGYLTNSLQMKEELSQIAPTEYVLLAVDGDTMRPHPPDPRYAHEIVYLGQMSTTKQDLLPMLRAVKGLGLAIYGMGWDRFPEAADLLPYWKGVLPLDDIALLYSSAQVVLATTEIAQRNLGMVNNRVFEVLACGAPLITDRFPELIQVLGDEEQPALYVNDDPAEVYHIALRLIQNATLRSSMGQAGRQHVLRHHTYDHRVEKILRFYQHNLTSTSSPAHYHAPRPNAPAIGLLYDSDAYLEKEWLSPAMMQLEKKTGDYRLSVNTLGDTWSLQQQEEGLAAFCEGLDLALLHALPESDLEKTFRSFPCTARKGLILPSLTDGNHSLSLAAMEENMLQYDVIVRIQSEEQADRCLLEDGVLWPHPNEVRVSSSWDGRTCKQPQEHEQQQQQQQQPQPTVLLHPGARTVRLSDENVHSMALMSAPLSSSSSSNHSHCVNNAAVGPKVIGQLNEAFGRALFAPPARSSILIEWPKEGELLVLNRQNERDQTLRVTVKVKAEAFCLLQDGYWCLRVNGQEVMCVGDDMWEVVIDLMPFLVGNDEGFSIGGDESRITDIELQAILEAEGLEYPIDYRHSHPIHLRVLHDARSEAIAM